MEHKVYALFNESAYDTLEHFSKAIEEFLEMAGNTCFWLVFLNFFSTLRSKISINLK